MEASSTDIRNPAASAPAALLPVFAATLLCSALLMFLIQPMVAKTVLPALGGSPQVWNTCMVFFQSLLFAGYLYAHFSTRLLGPGRQMGLHVALLGMAVLMLPLGIDAARLSEPDESRPVWWLIATLLVSVGLPVFIMSATAPLVQAWFSQTRHRSASDPYFLYVSSNVGSFVALLAYPILVEPRLGVTSQWTAWSVGYALLAGLLLACMAMAWRWRGLAPLSTATAVVQEVATSLTEAAPSWPRRLRWVLLALAPSSLLMGVTTYITTDVAAVPLFWVLPLALYLLSFMLAFAQSPWLSQSLVLRIQSLTIILLVVSLLVPILGHVAPWPTMVLHLLAFFFAAWMCHGELHRLRPHSAHLTEFYLWLSFGGVLGGVFNALVAPIAFDRVIEYPIAMALVCLLRPATLAPRWTRDLGLPVMVAVVALASLHGAKYLLSQSNMLSVALILAVALGVAFVALAFRESPVRFGVLMSLTLAIPWLPDGVAPFQGREVATSWTGRSFFGTYKVKRDDKRGAHLFVHGSTLHGMQWLDQARSRVAGTYYHPAGAFAQALRAAPPALADQSVGVVGLGVGSLACYRAPASRWTFYEIDPLVEAVARDNRFFTFLRDCAPDAPVILGDARIALRAAQPGQFGMLVIDAFSSDSIPTHLLTREALALYRSRLAPGGWLLLHISNRYLDLLPAVAALAADAGLQARVSLPQAVKGADWVAASPGQVVVLTQAADSLTVLDRSAAWVQVDGAPVARIWTDDYANVIGALKFRQQ